MIMRNCAIGNLIKIIFTVTHFFVIYRGAVQREKANLKGGGYQKMIWVSEALEGVLGKKKSKPCERACRKEKKC